MLDRIDVVIVNYRTGLLAVSALASLEEERRTLPNLRAIVVDNASGDGSADLVAQHIAARGWTWVTLLRSPRNGGYGAGNNIGIDHALGRAEPADLVWLLNPDTLVRPGAGAALASFMTRHPRAGIAGSALLEADGQPWPFAFRFPSFLGEIERGCRSRLTSRVLGRHATLRRMGERSERVDWVSGASFMVKRAVFESGTRFDEGYFLYYEETDLCREVQGQGWECWYVPAAVVMHISGQSTGVTAKEGLGRRLPGYWFASRQRYFLKNHGRLYSIAADLGWAVSHLVFSALRRLRSAERTDPPCLVRDLFRQTALLRQAAKAELPHGRLG
jgi:hypothetical protein